MFSLSAPGLMAALLLPSCALLADAVSLSSLGSSHGLQRRIDGEHVVLADCRDPNGVVSSQMAYYQALPDSTPEDVAVVNTNPGEAALWINRKTSGLFTDTGVTFTSTIGPKVADGQYAGTGNNGYGNFSCWQTYRVSLYTYGGTQCSQVYLCNHDPAPAVLPTPVNTTNPSASGTSSPQATGGLSQGAIVGIVVGVVGALLLAASIGLFLWYWRRTNSNKQPPAYSKRGAGCCGLFKKPEFAHPPLHSPSQDYKMGDGLLPEADAKAVPRPHEMDTTWERAEMGAGHGRVEMEGQAYAGADMKVQSQQQAYEMYSPPPQSAMPESPVLYKTAPASEQEKDNPK